MTRNQERALAALIGSPTQEAAAAKAGITSRTLRRYLQDPEFSAEYERLTGQLVVGAALQAQKSLAPALNALLEIATDADAGMGPRVQAARGLLEYGIRLSELADVYSRIEALEEAMEVAR